MSTSYCIIHEKEHEAFGWKNRGEGWYCSDALTYPEFTTEDIKKDREKYASDMVQSHRGGKFSREYAELYPERTKDMISKGIISKEEVRKSDYVWKGDIHPSWERNKRADARDLTR